jgi:sulfate permease, SulP family
MGKSMNFVDIAGAELIAAEARWRRSTGGGLYCYGLREEAARMLGKDPFRQGIGEGASFATKREAIAGIFECLDRGVCATCTKRIFEECKGLPLTVSK